MDKEYHVLVSHPTVGSLWLDKCYIRDETVWGRYWDSDDSGSAYRPDDYSGEYAWMGFSINCIRKDPNGLLKNNKIQGGLS